MDDVAESVKAGPPSSSASGQPAPRPGLWVPDATILALCAAILALALAMHGDDQWVWLGSVKIPVLCASRRLFDVECPGCGMTRAFVYLAHGHPLDAFRVNKLSLPMFGLVLSQVPLRFWAVARTLRR